MDQNSKSLLKSPFHIELNVAFRKLRKLEKLAKEVKDSGWVDDSRWYPKQVEKEAIGVVAALEGAMPLSPYSGDYSALKLAQIKKAIRSGDSDYVADIIRPVLEYYIERSLSSRVRMQQYLEVMRVLLLFTRIEDAINIALFTLDEKTIPWICLLYGESPPSIVVDPRSFIATRDFLHWLPDGISKLIVRAIKSESWSELRNTLRNLLHLALQPEQVLPMLALLWTIEEYVTSPSHDTCDLFHSTKAKEQRPRFRPIN